MKKERMLRAQDLPEDWKPGDSGVILDDSDMEPPDLSVPPLRSLNNAQRGSFGEFLFSVVATRRLGEKVQAVRRNRTDFLVGKIPVDVKTTIRDLDRALPSLRPYRGRRTEAISYAQVEFSAEGARVSLELNELDVVPWPAVIDAWQQWKDQSRTIPASPKEGTGIGPIRLLVQEHFAKLGFRARVIYRTIQGQFRNESPANLLPRTIEDDRITVFLDFIDHRLVEDNIRRVIMFPDVVASTLPFITQTRLHRPKVDLSQIPGHFVFASLVNLFLNAEQVLNKTSQQL
jgi:hypothetical protein